MSDERRWIRWQAVTGLVFATFLALHLGNAMAAALGQGTYDAYLGAARRYYQIPLIEVTVLGLAGAVHVAVGISRCRRRRRRRRAHEGADAGAPVWLRLHRAAGWFLVLVVGGHVAATRGPGLLVDMPADFSYLAFSLTEWPLVMFPYYFVLFGAGAFHLLHGGLVALGALGVPVGSPGAVRTRVLMVLGLLAGGVGILSMGGLLGEVDTGRFEEFRAFYERHLPFMVTW